MRLLHLSDIHFREPDCLDPRHDPERPFRSLILQDLRRLCHARGSIDAIVVSGDIAFKAHLKEYEVADQWLRQLATEFGCPVNNILLVPGNHDIDRSLCSRSMSVSNAQEAIASAKLLDRELILRKQLRDQETAQAIFSPLSNYNKFAASFGCSMYPQDGLSWQRDFVIGSNVILRIHGLNSTILSGLGDRDSIPGKLYLSPLQTAINNEDGVINLVTCHHPPSWLSDSYEVEDIFRSRAAVQLFGHEHRQRCTRESYYIRFAAGAVHPERREPDWRPGYNVIELTVEGKGKNRVVVIRADLRHIQTSPEMFVPILTKEGDAVWQHQISLPDFVQPIAVTFPPSNNSETQFSSAGVLEGSSRNTQLIVPEPPESFPFFVIGNLRLPVNVVIGSPQTPFSPDEVKIILNNRLWENSTDCPMDLRRNLPKLIDRAVEEHGLRVDEIGDVLPRLDSIVQGHEKVGDRRGDLEIIFSKTTFGSYFATNSSVDAEVISGTRDAGGIMLPHSIRDAYCNSPADLAKSMLANPPGIDVCIISRNLHQTPNDQLIIRRRSNQVLLDRGFFQVSATGHISLAHVDASNCPNPFYSAIAEAKQEVSDLLNLRPEDFKLLGLGIKWEDLHPAFYGYIETGLPVNELLGGFRRDSYEGTLFAIPFQPRAVLTHIISERWHAASALAAVATLLAFFPVEDVRFIASQLPAKSYRAFYRAS